MYNVYLSLAKLSEYMESTFQSLYLLLINNNGQRLLNYQSFIEEKRNCITFRDKYGNCIRFVQFLKKSARD